MSNIEFVKTFFTLIPDSNKKWKCNCGTIMTYDTQEEPKRKNEPHATIEAVSDSNMKTKQPSNSFQKK